MNMKFKKIMLQEKFNRPILNSLLLISILFVLSIIIFLQYTNPYLYGCDSYYHIRVPYFIKEFGIKYDFPWAQFSTFKNCFSDKEFLFHVLILPFTFLGKDIHTQTRFSVVSFSLILLLTYLFILKKYVTKPIQILAILSLPLSSLFMSYINYLRPKTMAIVIILILLYMFIEKKWIGVFFISLIYTLTHISYPFAIILALGIEILRYIHKKEFFIRTPIYSLLGITIGIFIHPNFPNNFVSLHLNAIIVPWSTMFGGLALNYGLEWNPANTRAVILDSSIFFIALFFIITILITKRPKIGFPAIAFFFATSFFLFLSMFSNCYWYFTYPLGITFIGMFFSDLLKDNPDVLRKTFICTAGAVLILSAFIITKADKFSEIAAGNIQHNSHYELMGNWMAKHIPPEKTIFHSDWSDSPYFICLNPKDYYLVVLDPIYMYYYSPEIYKYYNHLSHGWYENPYDVLKETFKVEYGYTNKKYGLYNQIKEDREKFKILFEDDTGAIFQLVESVEKN